MEKTYKGLFFSGEECISIRFYIHEARLSSGEWSPSKIENKILKPNPGCYIGFISNNTKFKKYIQQDRSVCCDGWIFTGGESPCSPYWVTSEDECECKMLLCMDMQCQPCDLPSAVISECL